MEGQVMPPPPRAIVVHAAAWEDVGRIGVWLVGAPGGAERVDGPARPGAARSRLWAAVADAARCSAPVAAAVKEPHFPEKLLRSRTYEPAARRPARPL